jgi:hypothetical protein
VAQCSEPDGRFRARSGERPGNTPDKGCDGQDCQGECEEPERRRGKACLVQDQTTLGTIDIRAERWTTSADRTQLAAEIADAFERENRLEIQPGIAFWFTPLHRRRNGRRPESSG